MLVRATRRVLTGEEVVIAFKPPRSNQWFDAIATIARVVHGRRPGDWGLSFGLRSEEHTSELQSHSDLVCRLLLEKKKQLAAQVPAMRSSVRPDAVRWVTIREINTNAQSTMIKAKPRLSNGTPRQVPRFTMRLEGV